MRALAAGLLAVSVAAPHAATSTDVDRARARANQAAAALAAAESRVGATDERIADLEARRADDVKRLQALQAGLRDVAIDAFMRGVTSPDPLLDDPTDVSAVVRARALADIVSAGSSQSLDAYRALVEDLGVEEARLTALRKSAAAALASYKKQQASVDAELARLEKQLAASKSTPPPPPKRSATRIVGNGEWMCPVQGPRAFSDDFGQPRSGGRSHQGNDILSPRGTPVVAPVAGSASQRDNGLGGHAFYLNGIDGNTYYGAHLDSYSDNYGNVPQGTVLGWVGNSGDAAGGPTHLHLEIHPGGGGAIDPYPTLEQYC